MINYKIMQNFTLKNIPNLDICVLGALELFSNSNIPKIKIPYKKPLIVGSGNAESTGRIIFRDQDAVFASESNFENKLKKIKSIDGVVLISASAGKHAPIIAKCSKKYKKHITLITNTPHTFTEKFLDKKHKYDEYIFPKQKEPYTYNTSTYMGMILGQTQENPKKIHEFIKNKIEKLRFPKFGKYNKYYIILPPEFSEIVRMLNVKFIELFGRQISRDIETTEYVKHATTVVPSNELFISFGVENKLGGEKKNRFHVPLPKNPNYGSVMAVTYYIIGNIQKSHPPYFKRNIVNYTKKISKIFKQEIKPIVE